MSDSPISQGVEPPAAGTVRGKWKVLGCVYGTERGATGRQVSRL